MNQITNPPLDYDFGYSFNYDVWTPGTTVTLCKVPWDSQYRDCVRFASKTELDNFLSASSLPRVIDDLFFVKPSNPVIKLDVPYNEALKYNYIRVSNSAQPINGDSAKSFYYFITDVIYVAPNTTQLVIMLDVWQSFIYHVNVKSGYLEQGHYAVKKTTNYTDSWLNVPEAIETGARQRKPLAGADRVLIDKDSPVVINTSVSFLYNENMDENGNPLVRAPFFGGSVQGMRIFTEAFVIAGTELNVFVQEMSYLPWIMQGVQSIVRYPAVLGMPNKMANVASQYIRPLLPPPLNQGGIASSAPLSPIAGFRTLLENVYKAGLPASEHWRITRFKKLITGQFTSVDMTTYQGNMSSLDPLMINGENLELKLNASLIPGDEKLFIEVSNYLIETSFNNALSIQNLPMLPTIADRQGIAQATAKASLSVMKSGAEWSQQRALAGNQTAYDNARTGIDLSTELANQQIVTQADNLKISNDLANSQAQTGLGGSIMSGIMGGAGGGAFVGGAAGAGVGALGGVGNALIGHHFNNANLQAQLAASAGSTVNAISSIARASSATGAAQGKMNDRNKSLADWAARGDYAQAIAAIDAKVTEMNAIPASVQGTVGVGTSLMSVNGSLKLVALSSTLTNDAVIRVTDMWSRYGYMFNRFIDIGNDLHAMKHFSYWRLKDVYIDSANMAAPENILNTLRGILEKGVTVWKDVNKIGNYDFEGNTPL